MGVISKISFVRWESLPRANIPAVARRFQQVAVCAAVLAAAACGGAAAPTAAPHVPIRLLPAADLPGLAATDTALDATALGHDAPVAALRAGLASWGFVAGRQREFKGASKVFTDVVSRSLVFADAAGARAYVAFVGRHAASFFGLGTTVRPTTSRGRPGYFVRAGMCGCHRETPVLLTVVNTGPRVSWLLVNGPGATAARAAALAAKMP